jgi:glycosyltransferase involved in cell wall biosynthesis
VKAGPVELDAVWVIVPSYDEGRRIGRVLDELLLVVRHVAVVDDGSSDETAREVMKRPVWLLRHQVNLGQGAALQTGLTFALSRGASHVVTFDADGQHCVADIPTLIRALSEHDADFALGSRFLGDAEGIPWSRRAVLRLGTVLTRLLSGVWLSDTHNGIRAMTRRGAERIRITFNRMEHASELIDQIVRSRRGYVEVPVRIRYTSDTLIKGQKTTAAIGVGLRLILGKISQ